MQFEVKWTRPFATNFFGRFVREGGSVQVSASLAIQLHEAQEGWVCDEIQKVRQSLEPKKDVTITDGDLVETVKIPQTDATEITAEVEEEGLVANAFVTEVLPRQQEMLLTGPAPQAQPTSGGLKCDECPDLTFTSKKKLAAHKTQVHQNG